MKNIRKKIALLFLLVFLTGCHENDPLFSLTYCDDEGEVILVQEIFEEGTIPDAPEAPEKIGYTFVGWDQEFQNASVDLTIKTVYAPNRYSISFDSAGGEEFPIMETMYDTSINLLPIPTQTGYEFLGWFLEDTLVSMPFVYSFPENITLIARWRTLDEFSISFNSYGAGSIDSIAVYDGSLISELPIPERTNYDFLGWHYEDELLNLPFDYNFGKDIALTAKWEINIEYVISFMTDGGDPLAPLLVHDGDQITELPVPTKYGYWFLGWYHNDQLITAPLTFDYLSDITLTAKWEKANYAAFLRFKNYYENWIIGLTESFVSSQATGNSNGNSEELHYQTHVIEDEGYLITEIWGNNDPLVTVEMSVIEGELIRTTTLHDGLKHVIVTEHLGPAISYGSDYIGEFEESLLHSLNCTNTWMTYQIKGDWSYSAEGTLWEMGQYFAEERLGLTYDQYFELRDLVMTINYSFNDSMDTFRVSFDLEGFYIDDEYWKFDSVETVQKIR